MKYILTKDDLLDLKYEVPSVKIFLKSKQPVKEIANFKPSYVYEHISLDCHNYIGKNIKIYISKE